MEDKMLEKANKNVLHGSQKLHWDHLKYSQGRLLYSLWSEAYHARLNLKATSEIFIEEDQEVCSEALQKASLYAMNLNYFNFKMCCT